MVHGRRGLCALVMLGLVVTGLVRPASAHPHVFVDAEGGFEVDAAGQLVALQVVWLYDAFTTLVLYDQLSLDADGDGKLDAADLAKVAAGETDWAPDYAGDTYLLEGEAPVALGRPQAGVARMQGDRVEVRFRLPLVTPLALAGKTLRLKPYDPSYYYAYTLKPDEGLAVPAHCRQELIPFEPGDADLRIQKMLAQLSTEEMPEDPNIGARFADELRLTCE